MCQVVECVMTMVRVGGEIENFPKIRKTVLSTLKLPLLQLVGAKVRVAHRPYGKRRSQDHTDDVQVFNSHDVQQGIVLTAIRAIELFRTTEAQM